MQTPFTSAPHDVVLVLLVQMVALLVTARVLGEVAQRFKLPSVVGEILAGVVLGPSLLSGFFPALSPWLVPDSEVQGYLLESVSLIGALLLMLLTGLELDVELVRRRARTALGTSLGGVTLTMAGGYFLAIALPDDMRSPGMPKPVFALFVAVVLSISAIPVIAKVLMELKVMRRDIGQTIIAAGMSDDTIGWILLSVVVALASGAEVSFWSVSTVVFTVLGFIAFSLLVVRRGVERLVRIAQELGVSAERMVSLVVVLTLGWAAVTQALHLEAVLGAFVMGIVLGQVRRLTPDVVHRIESMGIGVFAPIFFAVAGLKIDIWALMEPRLIAITLVVIFLGTVCKVGGSYLGARFLAGRPHLVALAYGSGLNARGTMGIILAAIGLRLNIVSPVMFSILVVMAVVTSLMAPPALRWLIARIEPDDAERDRIRREELRSKSKLGRLTRALVPVRTRVDGAASTQSAEAFILGILEKNLALTLMTVSSQEQRAASLDYLAQLRKLMVQTEVTTKVVVDQRPATAILEEASRDYDLLVVGASEGSTTSPDVFNPVVDELVRSAPCPSLVIRGQSFAEHSRLRRILVPSSGTEAERTAAELAFMLARDSDTEVSILHIVIHPDGHTGGDEMRALDRKVAIANESLESLSEIAQSFGAKMETSIRFGTGIESEVLAQIARGNYDLLVLGTSIMVGTRQLYLGPTVERLLEQAPCPVLVLNT